MTRPKIVPDPSHVRTIRGSFGWIDHRLLRDGHLAGMTWAEIALYVFLVLAADRNGVSYYRLEHIGKILGLYDDDFHQARAKLTERRLIAFCPFRPGDVNGYCQVLPLESLSQNLRG